jgi:uroporphyrinogen decarboxylase
MTTYERFKRMYEHREADRIPIIDSPWAGTLRRWRREGMPEGADWRDYFDIDKTEGIGVDITPRYEVKVLEDTDRYQIVTTSWGVTLKNFKELDSTPEFIDYKVVDPEAWADAKARMTLDDDRIPWAHLKNNYERWRAEGRWIEAGFWFGFDVTHSWMAGTETVLVALYEDPDWARDMFDTYLDRCIALFGRIWDAGYRFDAISWPDDMGYKGTTFFSKEMYREILRPVHKRAVDWAHERGIYAHLHSCGDVMSFVDDLVEIGIDCLNPLEVKAGMEPLTLKKQYGDRLALHGGINAVLWDNKDAIVSEIDRLVPVLKENGGYIFSSDHSIPNSVSLENMKAIMEEVKRAGKY